MGNRTYARTQIMPYAGGRSGFIPFYEKGAHPFPGRWNPAAAVNNERHQAGQIFPASPLFQRIPLILAHQPEQFCTGITLRRPLSHPPRPRRRRKLQIRPVKHGPIQPLKSQLNHPAALVIRHGGGLLLQRRQGTRHKQHAVHSAIFPSMLGHANVPLMHGIKRTAENTQLHRHPPEVRDLPFPCKAETRRWERAPSFSPEAGGGSG